jgi:hypothetical protein
MNVALRKPMTLEQFLAWEAAANPAASPA